MIKKSDLVREAVRQERWKDALRIAKDFRRGITSEQRDAMCRAYECMVHPGFYEQIGTNIPEAISKGKDIVAKLYS